MFNLFLAKMEHYEDAAWSSVTYCKSVFLSMTYNNEHKVQYNRVTYTQCWG